MEKRSAASAGRAGEDAAAAFLVRRGMRLLARNVRTRAGEIDLVAEEGDTVVFVEVKARATLGAGSGAEAVTPRRVERLRRSAEAFLAARRWTRRQARLDVVSVRLRPGGPAVCDHIEDLSR